jgi:predicted nuclease with TOPRIM domain
LWQETFRQELDDEERIVIATNKFKPDNILVGQGYIAAESRQKAIEWLNIVRTALIFVDDNEDDLKRQLPSNDETKPPEVIDDYEIPNTFENFWD